MKQPGVQVGVQVGQVWADNDKRGEGRTVRVDEVDVRYAYCTVLTAATPGGRTGHRTRIALERMRPTSTGYRLLDGAP
ncbi:hypothetical protein [Streptomyces aurantiogriseus]|uniref:Uncharacterized protein n=1 Tax=Streptomyces aurantiogriseus TaxID=66870 RepID=A0A918C520_9ACTN|nr:hypothetical protein [Streptomyces aurantiogriseus]GGR06188.1 hypothetical protein GCM10010251_22410 [Streptomyces aurantiogriseus]